MLLVDRCFLRAVVFFSGTAVVVPSEELPVKLDIFNTGMDLLGGCGGVHTPPSPGQVGCRGGAIFMKKQKNMRDIMKYTL